VRYSGEVTAADSTLAISQPNGGSAATRLAGLVGVVGGAVLLAAFVVDIPPGLNDVRLTLFFVGTLAVAAAS
jgi:hypothetical protein